MEENIRYARAQLKLVWNLIEVISMGIFIGGIYALIGLGLSLTFTGLRFIMNLAHGQLVVTSAYLSYVVVSSLRIDPLFSMAIVLPMIFCLGFILQYTLLNKALNFDLPTCLTVILGVGLVIQNTLLLIFGPDTRSLGYFASYATIPLNILGVHLPLIYLIDFVFALIVMVIFFVFLKRTYLGRAIRATSEDYICAQLYGINFKRIYAFTFGLGGVLAAIGGVLIGLTFSFDPSYGDIYLGIGFSVLILGGLGSIRGAITGGIVLGLMQALASYYIGISYANLISNLLTLIILAIRPQGLLGYKV